MKKFKKWLVMLFAILGILVFNYRKKECKPPELISTISSMNHEYCSIIIHKSCINDKVELALYLIEVCRENAFENIKFATDIRGYPSALHLTVYLNKIDFLEGAIFMTVKYIPEENNDTCTIVDENVQYELYVDQTLIKDCHNI